MPDDQPRTCPRCRAVVDALAAEAEHAARMCVEALVTCVSPTAAEWYAGYLKGLAFARAELTEQALIDLRDPDPARRHT